MAVDYHNYSKFSWSFTGYETIEKANEALENMKEWFNITYTASEWSVEASVYASPSGYGARLDAKREVQNEAAL